MSLLHDALLRRKCALLCVLIVGATTSPAARPDGEETPFLTVNHAAMAKMMRAMEITPAGDVDRDFVAMMVPHHQGAIDMAEAVLRYGRNEQIRRIAQEIIITQQQEIVAMRSAVGEPVPSSVPSPDPPSSHAPSAAQPSSLPSTPRHEEPRHETVR